MSTERTPRLGRALEKWRAMGLTPSQIRTELERFAANMEQDRAKLVEALRRSTPPGCQAMSPGSPNYAGGRECGKCAHCTNTALLRELGEAA